MTSDVRGGALCAVFPGSMMVAATLLVVVAVPAAAHHGFAVHYDPSAPVRIEGTVVSFDFRNPHSSLTVEARDEAGATVLWTCEMASRGQLSRRGVTEESFQPGEAIIVEGVAARRDPLGCEFGASTHADGRVFVGRTLDNRQTQFNLHFASEDPGTVTGNWIRKRFPGGGRQDPYDHLFTPEGARVHADYDEVFDSPVLRCSPSSPLKLWDQPGHTVEIRAVGEDLVIQAEFMDSVRVVDMGATGYPDEVAPSTLGHSIGRWDGEVLVIETARFEPGVLLPNGAGILNSPELVFTERLSVNEEGDLLVDWTAQDPVHFTGPVTGQRVMARTTSPVGPYDCVPEVVE